MEKWYRIKYESWVSIAHCRAGELSPLDAYLRCKVSYPPVHQVTEYVGLIPIRKFTSDEFKEFYKEIHFFKTLQRK